MLITKELSIIGSRSCTKEELEEVFQLVENGLLKPILAHVMPLKDALKAQSMLENQQVAGRIVLIPNKVVNPKL